MGKICEDITATVGNTPLVKLNRISREKVCKATAWKGFSPGGHHRRGTLEFPELKGNPQTIKLIIRGIADVPTRVFEWKLES